MYEAFLSHASNDRELADRVCHWLRDQNIRVFYSHDSIQPSEHFPSALQNGIKNSRSLVLLVSQASLESKWVREEVDSAVTQRIGIVPVFIEAVELKAFHPIGIHLKYLHRLDLYSNFDTAIRKLADLVNGDRTANAGRVSPVETMGTFHGAESVPVPNAPHPAPSDKAPPIGRKMDNGSTSHQSAEGEQDRKKSPEPATTEGLQPTKPAPSARTRVDPKELLERLMRDVDRGDREAAYFLSRLHLMGLYVPKDEGRAVRYLQLAARGERGMPEAMHDLAELYRLAKGVGRNSAKAISLHEDAARRGFAPSFYRLGRLYQEGTIVPRDPERACRRFLAASELGYAPAAFRLAEACLAGAGMQPDAHKAFDWAMMAADKHYPPALNLVGRMHRKGIHVKQSDFEACNWYEKAMRQGNAEGAYNLASMYRRGLGRPQDELLARRYFDAASQLLSGADPETVMRKASILVETQASEPEN